MNIKKMIISSTAVAALLAGGTFWAAMAWAETNAQGQAGHGMKMESSTAMPGHGDTKEPGHVVGCPMVLENTAVDIKNIEKGAVITITSNDPKVVKEIQQHAQIMKDCAVERTKDGTVICPVTGTKISKSKAVDTAEYKGQTYYFCCGSCKPQFMKDPEKYVNKEGK